MATGRGGRTSTQRKSVAKKNPTRATTAANKKITKLNKGSANSGTGKRAQANNAARAQRVNDIERRKEKNYNKRYGIH